MKKTRGHRHQHSPHAQVIINSWRGITFHRVPSRVEGLAVWHDPGPVIAEPVNEEDLRFLGLGREEVADFELLLLLGTDLEGKREREVIKNRAKKLLSHRNYSFKVHVRARMGKKKETRRPNRRGSTSIQKQGESL